MMTTPQDESKNTKKVTIEGVSEPKNKNQVRETNIKD